MSRLGGCLLGWMLICGPCCALAADVEAVVSLLAFVIEVDEETAGKCLQTLTQQVQSGELSGDRLAAIRQQLDGKLQPVLQKGPEGRLYWQAALLAASWGQPAARQAVARAALSENVPAELRLAALDALAAARDPQLLTAAGQLLREEGPVGSHILTALSRFDDEEVPRIVLTAYSQLPAELQPRAIELLTQRAHWSKALLEAIGRGGVDRAALNVNQVRKLLASRDPAVVELVRKEWGEVRTERNPQREQVLEEMRELLSKTRGNPHRGRQVFDRVCGQCHKIYGHGQDVGPEITSNGRGNFEQLLSNVFDPSLVIGAAYQARTVITADGRVLTGLVTEDSGQRIVLKTQGGKLEIVPRDEVDEIAVSQLSLMPEGLETQLAPQELADLFAFLVLDQPPDHPAAAVISGTPSSLLGE